MKHILLTMRPGQWTKNLVVFAGLLFSKHLFDTQMMLTAGLAFLVFCALSGSVYLVNDLIDIEADRRHPRKRNRPLASGKVSPASAVAAAVLFSGVGIALSFLVLGVSFGALLDVMSIAVGFVLRAIGGVEALKSLDPSVILSPWLLVCTLFLSLLLALGKRRHELSLLEVNAGDHRRSLHDYSTALLDQLISVVTASTAIAYAIYTIWPGTIEKFETRNLLYTVPFVVYGLFRYLYLLWRKEEGGNPSELILTDLPLAIDVLLWLLVAGVVLYRF